MPITAKLLCDTADFKESLRWTRRGWVGTRNYCVNTINTSDAMFADGLPRVGDAWGSNRPELALLTVSQVGDSVLMGGRDDGTGTGGWTRIPVLYETPSGGSTLPVSPSSRWTEINIGRGQFQTLKTLERHSLNSDGSIGGIDTLEGPPVGNGDGAPVGFGVIEARIYTYHALTDETPWATIFDLSRPSALNDDSIRMPPLYGDTRPIIVDKGQAMYLGIDQPVIVNNLRQIVHILELSNDFYFRWFNKSADGSIVGTGKADRVNPYRSWQTFMSLWA